MITRRHFTQSLAAASVLGSLPAWAQARTLTYIGWSQDEAASKPTLTAMFESFRQANPDVKLDVVGFPWGQVQQNTLLRLRSGQAVDVVQLNERWLPQFASAGRLVDLDQVYGKGTLAKRIDPGVLRLGQYRGKQLGMPWTAASIGMVANAKVLKDVGVATSPATIDAFLEVLKAVKKANPASVPYAMATKNNNTMSPDFQAWLWTFGGRLFDAQGKVAVNSAAGVRALGFMADLVKDGLAAKDIDRPDARRMFVQGTTAFYQDAPLARAFARNNSGKGAEFDVNVLAMATPVLRSGDTPQSIAWGHILANFGAGKTSMDPKAPAYRLMDHLALDDANQLKQFKELGLFPVTNSALAQLASDPYVSTWSRAARSAQLDETALWPNSADLTTIVGEEVQGALLSQKSAQAAIEAMAKRLEAKIAEAPKA